MIITIRLDFLIRIYHKFKAKLDDIPVDEISEVTMWSYALFLFRMMVECQFVL